MPHETSRGGPGDTGKGVIGDVADAPQPPEDADPFSNLDDLLAFLDGLEEEEDEGGGSASSGSFSENTTSIGRFRTDTTRSITETIRRYVDIPTAAQFLDDFETGTNAYLAGLRDAGQISQFDMDLARGQMGTFLDEYLGELGLRAARGEDIFEVVGLAGEIERLGTRPGEQSTQQTTEKEKTTGSQTTSGSTSGTSTTDGKTSTTSDSSKQTSKTDRENISTDKTTRSQTEEVFSRPQLFAARKFSPMEFFQSRFKEPGEFATVLRSRAGRGQAIATRGGSGITSGARRA